METPTKKQKQSLLKLGYEEEFFRVYPQGYVSGCENKDTNFILESTNTFVNKDKTIRIQPRITKENKEESPSFKGWRIIYFNDKNSKSKLNGRQLTAKTLDEMIMLITLADRNPFITTNKKY